MGLVDAEPPNNDTDTQSQEPKWFECNLLSRKPGPRRIAVLKDSGNVSFTVCWDCYKTSISPSPLSAFFSSQVLPATGSASCKFAEFWVRFAWFHILQGKGDVDTLLLGAGRVTHREGGCPNAHLISDSEAKPTSNRTWYSITNPDTGIVFKQWAICGDCCSQIQNICAPIATAFTKIPATPARGACDLVPKVSSTRSLMCLEELMSCEITTEETGEIDIRPLVDFIKRFANVPACPKDVPTATPRKFYHVTGASEYAICEDCYLTTIEPDAKAGIALAQEVVLSPKSRPRMTCQLYSERMRTVWQDAVTSSDRSFLLQKLSERRTKERDLQIQTSRLTQTRVQLQQQAEMYNTMSIYQRQHAFNQLSANQMAFSYASASNAISGSSWTTMPTLKPLDLSQSQNSSNKATMTYAEITRVNQQLTSLKKEWKTYWE